MPANKFGSLFRPGVTVDKEMDRLAKELRSIAPVKELKTHSGWRKIESVLHREIREIERRILKYSERPEHNANILQTLAAMRLAYLGVIDFVEAPLAKEPKLWEELRRYSRFLQGTGATDGPPQGESLDERPR